MLTRSTRQRSAILDALQDAEGFLTAQQLHRTLAQAGSDVGLATVYRNLQTMAEAHEVDMVMQQGEASYRRCGSAAHHHHLVCRRCGHTVEIASPGVEAWTKRIAKKHSFSKVTHELEVFGLCADCGDGQ